MKYLMLLALISCASDQKVLKQLSEKKLTGYWTNRGYTLRGKEKKKEFLHITCRGNIDYFIESPHYWLFGDDEAAGTILEVKDYTVRYRNWTQFKSTDSWHISPPTKQGGCWKLSFKNTIFYAVAPKDCSRPEETFTGALQTVWDYYSTGKKPPTCDELRE